MLSNIFGRKGEGPDYFSDENYEQVRNDLEVFFGPRAERFLSVFDKMRARVAEGKNAFVNTTNVPAFFLSFVWFFYRKMYLYAALMILVPFVIAMLFDVTGNLAISIVIMIWANYGYVQFGLARVRKADTLGLLGDERTEYLRKAGGVSLAAGLVSGALYAAFTALAFLVAFRPDLIPS